MVLLLCYAELWSSQFVVGGCWNYQSYIDVNGSLNERHMVVIVCGASRMTQDMDALGSCHASRKCILTLADSYNLNNYSGLHLGC